MGDPTEQSPYPPRRWFPPRCRTFVASMQWCPRYSEISRCPQVPKREMAINRAATVWCHPRCTSQSPRGNPFTDGEHQLRACARVALVSLTLSASFCLVGCTAIDDLNVSILQWFDTVNSTRDGEEPLAYAPEPRLIPPADIPKRAAKAPRKMIKAAKHKLQRPPIVVLPEQQPPILDAPETPSSGETEGHSAGAPTMQSRTPYTEAPRSFDERFCAVCWSLPQKPGKS
jgi:hypothetical protein